MDIHGLKFSNISANVADLGHIENARGIKILGLIGTGLFQGMEMELDLKNNFLGLYHINRDGSRVYPEKEMPADLEIPLEISSSLWFIKGYIAGKKLRFVLDTGAETNVLNTNISRKVIEKVELNNLTTLKGSNASTVQVASGTLPELYVMGQVYENMPFVLTDLSNLELAYDTTMDGMLGYAFLRYGRMVINTKKKYIKVYFYKDEK
jgi:hypothetical protein